MTKRDVPGFAIGGLSGGESKAQFWKMVALSTSMLPRGKPRYLMGVGYVGRGERTLRPGGGADPGIPIPSDGFLGKECCWGANEVATPSTSWSK